MAATMVPAIAQVVCLGASHTAGKGVSSLEAFPAQLELLLRARGYTGSVVNAGISGDTTAGMLARLSSVTAPGTRVVVLQPGGNDFRKRSNSSEDTREANISIVVDRLRERRIEVVMVENSMFAGLPQYRGPDGQHLTPEGYRILAAQLLPQVARALGLP
jgi:acyl-CoA thioesterase-1